MSRSSVHVLSVLALLVLGACGAPLDYQGEMNALRNAQTPFASARDIPYRSIAVGSTTAFRLDRSSPVMELPVAGKTFVQGFEMPPGSEDLRLTVVGLPMEGRRNVYPMVTLADAAKLPFAVTSRREIRPMSVSGFGTAAMGVPMLLDGELRARARYLIVHTSRDFVEFGEGPWFAEFQVAQRGAVPIFIFPADNRPPSLPASSPAGEMRITLTVPRT